MQETQTIPGWRGRKLPDDDELVRLHTEEGLSIKEIAARFGAGYEAVRVRLKQLGVQATHRQPRYDLPWRVKATHRQQAVIQHWFAYRRREAGLSRSDAEAAAVEQWITYMEGNNRQGVPLSIWYDPQGGFYLRRRRVGDKDYLSTD